MAKKAKAKKAKAKKSAAKKASSIDVPLSELARLFSVIARDPTATSEFMAAAKKRKVFVTTSAGTKTFVRRFLSTKNMLKPAAMKAGKGSGPPAGLAAGKAAGPAAAASGDRFECFD